MQETFEKEGFPSLTLSLFKERYAVELKEDFDWLCRHLLFAYESTCSLIDLDLRSEPFSLTEVEFFTLAVFEETQKRRIKKKLKDKSVNKDTIESFKERIEECENEIKESLSLISGYEMEDFNLKMINI